MLGASRAARPAQPELGKVTRFPEARHGELDQGRKERMQMFAQEDAKCEKDAAALMAMRST
jgi:hypothetical protein